MKAALETVAALPAAGRRVAVLGDMLELGAASERYHRELGEFAAGCRLDEIICVGAGGATIAHAAVAAGHPAGRVTHYRDSGTLASHVRKLLRDGDLVLLKASRGVRLEAVAGAIAAPQAAPLRRVAAS
jgi:UDP-N-acetylmuramoyl-tripeptide--D-alanyl-D-alanine ligase